MRQTWKNIHRQLGKIKISLCSSLSINNITIDDPKQITNHFNDYFVNSELVSNLPQLPYTLNLFYFYPTTLFAIKTLVNNSQPKNSFGTDEVLSNILKSTLDNVLLACMFNLSLTNDNFIFDFKNAKIVPIHKKGNATKVSITLLVYYVQCLKILKKLVYKLSNLISKQTKFFYKYKFGFRKNYLTLM